MAAEAGGVVLEAFLVGDDDGVVVVVAEVVVVQRSVALQDAVGEGGGLGGLDPGRSLGFWFRSLDSRIP